MTTTRLRMFYEILRSFSTATQASMCHDLMLQIKATGQENLAGDFAEALVQNKEFSQLEQPFISANRSGTPGRNPVAHVMKTTSIITFPSIPYEFTFIEREVPHLRATTLAEQPYKAWIDYVGHTVDRPVLGEIKWQSDQNPFYAFIQLLTYLSEIATLNQIQRSIKHELFGSNITAITAFDLHIFLTDFNDRGEKGKLIDPTFELVEAFKARLVKDYPLAASSLGNVLCLSGKIEDGSATFSNLKCLWMV